MGDQQAASPESLIFVSDVCSPSALSVLCVHGVLILMRACVGLGGQALGTLESVCTNSLGTKRPEWLGPRGTGNPGNSCT